MQIIFHCIFRRKLGTRRKPIDGWAAARAACYAGEEPILCDGGFHAESIRRVHCSSSLALFGEFMRFRRIRHLHKVNSPCKARSRSNFVLMATRNRLVRADFQIDETLLESASRDERADYLEQLACRIWERAVTLARRGQIYRKGL